MQEDLHRAGFRAGLNGKPPEQPENLYYMMAYRDDSQERERQDLVRGEDRTDWSAA